MVILVDTNIIVDALMQREPYVEDAQNDEMCRRGDYRVSGCAQYS